MNLLLDLFMAALLLGLPMVVLSWFLFLWLFASGEVSPEGDRKAITSELKKARKKIAQKERSNAHYVYDKWMWFGSGFYGLAGLWTFAVIEIMQLFGFLLDFPGWSRLLENGLPSFIIEFLVNQLVNLLQGLVWFSWWPAESILLWLLVAYLGYWSGVELARRRVAPPRAAVKQWGQRLTGLWRRHDDL
ncbi:MAG: hypothetical protein WD396_11130 [Pseudohongiellaceae bacterium]